MRLPRTAAGGPAPGRRPATPRPLVLPQFFLLVSFSKNLSGMAQSSRAGQQSSTIPTRSFPGFVAVSVKSNNQIVGGRIEPEVELLLLLAVAVGPHVGVEHHATLVAHELHVGWLANAGVGL
ncbi:hypothetical protein PVAP13_3NG119800 [Panicum virgatum]|uniref:Uncharacterized protein n=1 Tax=Panicum virgatum TaxID=38727 RepID=A0A8T0UFF5_PANVG|nr:hypothetical protein PVAP13_3NG119800 [Panicum virgatum]